VPTPDASDIASVVLMKARSVTHSFDMDQRHVGLSFTVGASSPSSLTVTDNAIVGDDAKERCAAMRIHLIANREPRSSVTNRVKEVTVAQVSSQP
jgi:hypothetical protein